MMAPPPPRATAPTPEPAQPGITPLEEQHGHLILCVDNSRSMIKDDAQSGSSRIARCDAVNQLCTQLLAQQLSDPKAAATVRCSYVLFHDRPLGVFADESLATASGQLHNGTPSCGTNFSRA